MIRTALFACLFSFYGGRSIQAETTRGRIVDRKGEVVAETVEGTRRYPLSSTSHLTGYLRSGKNTKGVSGLEKSFEDLLGGGEDVALTIDARVQKIAGEVFPEGGKGAIVVIDPNSGAILALASFPFFDANDFFPAITREKYEQYQNDPDMPLFNRAIHESPPGSLYKIPTALAAGFGGFYNKEFRCKGSVQYGNKSLKCWILSRPEKMHQALDLSGAIKHSCNAYFYQLSGVIGIGAMERAANALGLTESTECGLPGESSGMIHTPAYFRSKGQEWSEIYSALAAIGQGSTTATPVQMASLAATIANGGKVFQPHLVSPESPREPTDLIKQGIDQEHIHLVRAAMLRVVNEEGGTGSNARSESVEIAGKTATAMTAKLNAPYNAWFIGFAPFESPRLAVCVFVENGKSGNRSAAPVAREVLIRSLSLPEE